MMKSIQRVLLVFAAVILLLPSFLVTASQNSNSSTSSEEVVQGAGLSPPRMKWFMQGWGQPAISKKYMLSTFWTLNKRGQLQITARTPA